MITYKNIGHFGRLGNQMFQFASTYGIAKKNAYDVCFPKDNMHAPSVERFNDGVTREVYFDIPKVFDIDPSLLCNLDDIQTQYNAQEPYFHFCEQLFSVMDNCNLNGYFQSEKYFKHCEQDIRKLFTFNKEIQEEAKDKLLDIVDDKILDTTISIHVRLGDYVNMQQYHPVMGSDYYQSALEEFSNEYDPVYIVYSDNIEKCKEIFPEEFHFVEGNSDYVDMCMMSMCQHNVIANSSFSWWAAWLNDNPNKKVIAPKNWFGPAYDGINNTKDLYPQSWIIK
jgi:hypothetical protein